MSSSEWKKRKIQDILLKVVDNRGKNPPFSEQGYSYIDTTCIVGDSRRIDYSLVRKYVSEETYATWFRSGHPIVDDLLIATVGANIGKVCLMDDSRVCIAQNTVGLRVNKDLANPVYFYYLLSSKEIQSYLKSLDVGSAQPSIKVPHLLNVAIDVPPLPTQRRIADILSALDEKIELNRQTNATLEAIAQAIFKEWFVDFNFPGATGEMVESELGPIPSGWRVGKLGEVCKNIRKGVRPKDIASDTAYVGLEHIPRKSLGLVSWGLSKDVDSQKTHFKKYDVLFGKLRPYFHKVCIAPVDGICSTDILVIEPNQHDYFSFCLNHLFSDELITYVSSIADGTRMPRVDWNSISNYQIIIPSHELIKEFKKITFPSYDSIIENNQESAILAALRDNLLPKLMNGEIDV